MKSWLLLLLLITSANSLLAQPPIVEWYKTLGGFEGDYAHSIWPTSDGGYITAGYTEGEGGDVVGYHGNKYLNDVWIVKLNRNGTVEWQKCLGGIGVEHGADIRQTPNGGYMVAFTSWSKDCDLVASHGGVDFMVVKLTPTGDIEWQKSYGGSKNEYAYSITPSTNGGYIVAGTTESGDGDVTGYHGKRDYWVIKIDDSGNLLWQKCLGGSGDDPALSAASTADGGCIVGGYTESSDGDVTTNHGQRDAWVVKLGGTGNLQWQKSFGGSSFDEAWSVQEGSDGGYIFAGRTTSNNGDVSGNHQSIGGFSDYWVVKLASNGSLQWQRCYGGKFNDEAYHIQNTSDGGYIITGKAEAATDDVSCLSGNNDAWLVKINNVGAIQWQKSLGGDGIDVGYCTRQLSDGSFIMAGFTCSNNITGWHPHTTSSGTCADFFLVKLSVPSPTPPKPSVKIKAGAICKGSVSTLVAESLNAGLILTYQWTRGGQPVGTNKSTYSAADFTDGEKVICLLVGNGLCENLVMVSDTVVIKLNNTTLNPTVNITADETAACNCMKLTFRATANGGGTAPAFQWQVNNNNTGNNGLAFSSKSLSPGDVVSCLYSDSSGCIANSYVISNKIRVTSGVGQAPVVNIRSSADTVCAGAPVSFTASATNAGSQPSFHWKVNNVLTGTNSNTLTLSSPLAGDVVTCSITIDPSFSCTTTTTATSNPIKIVIRGIVTPFVSITTPATKICAGASVTFQATTLNAGPRPAFLWIVNGSDQNINSPQFSSTTFKNGDVVSCNITADPLFSCVATTTAVSNNIVLEVTSGGIPSIVVTASPNQVCVGNTLFFTATTQDAGATPAYQWFVNNSAASGNRAATFSSNTLLPGSTVYCRLTPTAGACSSAPVVSNIITPLIYPLPLVSISPADTLIGEGKQLFLKAQVTGGISSFSWMPADKLVNPLFLTPFTIPLSDKTIYTLKVISDKGCKGSAVAMVSISKQLFMPNAFTPDGDGVNDVFRIPPGININLTEFSVFDRWGNKIFTTTDPSKGWNGMFEGTLLQSGVYVYMINGTTDKGKVLLKGTVVLSR